MRAPGSPAPQPTEGPSRGGTRPGAGRPAAPVHLGPRFQGAVAYALEAHAGQVRRATGVPVATHLLGVAALVLEHGGGEDEAIAALLHDAAEDQGGEARLGDIARRFGDRVTAMVRACSDTLQEPKPPWRPRKEAWLAAIARERDAGALLVATADKLHNTRSLREAHRAEGEAVWRHFRTRSRDDQLWYAQACVSALRDATEAAGATPLQHRLVAELADTVASLEAQVARARPSTGERH